MLPCKPDLHAPLDPSMCLNPYPHASSFLLGLCRRWVLLWVECCSAESEMFGHAEARSRQLGGNCTEK